MLQKEKKSRCTGGESSVNSAWMNHDDFELSMRKSSATCSVSTIQRFVRHNRYLSEIYR